MGMTLSQHGLLSGGTTESGGNFDGKDVTNVFFDS